MSTPENRVSETYINGLPLPSALLTLMNAGPWKFPDDVTEWNRLFPEHGSDQQLFRLESMQRHNRSWPTEIRPMFLGVPDVVKTPGDIDPKRSVLIGDLGIGSDQPIALDYRCSMENPRVLTLEWESIPDGNNQWIVNTRWIEIAPHITAFAELIGL